MYIYFVRHGESEANLLHEFSNRGWQHGLTAKGVRQVHVLAKSLLGISFDKIYTSPLKRAVQTAVILAGEFNINYEITDALREFDTGMNEGLSDQISWQRWDIVMDNWNRLKLYESRIPGGECFNDMKRRFIPFIERVYSDKESTAGNLMMIGHGALFHCMLPILFGLSPEVRSPFLFPNTGYVLSEVKDQGLVCLEWCGNRKLSPKDG